MKISEGFLKIGIALLLMVITLPYLAFCFRLVSYFVTDPADVQQSTVYAGPGGGAQGGVGQGIIAENTNTLLYKFSHSDDNLSDILTDIPKYFQLNTGLFDKAFTLMLDKVTRPFEYAQAVFDSFKLYLSDTLSNIFELPKEL